MPKFVKKPVVIEANRWFKNGDHPLDDDGRFQDGEKHEGQIVRYFHLRWPDISGDQKCGLCNIELHRHGWIETLDGGHIVCPGDWIITGVKGEMYPCKPDIFAATYELLSIT